MRRIWRTIKRASTWPCAVTLATLNPIPRDLAKRAGDPGDAIGLVTEYIESPVIPRGWIPRCSLPPTRSRCSLMPPYHALRINRPYYDQQGSSVLVHALARLVLVAEGHEPVGGLELTYAVKLFNRPLTYSFFNGLLNHLHKW